MSHERSDQTPIDSPVVDTTILTSEGVLKEVSKRSFLIDTITGTGPYQAIVLDAWREPVQPGAGTTQYASTEVITVNRVRARILKEYSDAHIRQFPAPKHLPTGPDVLMTEVDKYKINMHPVYTCRDGTADQPLPRIGSRIWVGYARIGSGGPDGLGQLPEYWLAAESVVGGEEGGTGRPGSAQDAYNGGSSTSIRTFGKRATSHSLLPLGVQSKGSVVKLITPAKVYKENRVRLGSFGKLGSRSGLLELVPNKTWGMRRKLHKLAAVRFKAMNQAFMKEMKGTISSKYLKYGLRVMSGTREQFPFEGASFEQYRQAILEKYKNQFPGRDAHTFRKGSAIQAFNSPHQTGLAMDLYFLEGGRLMHSGKGASKTVATQKKMKVFQWLKLNAHRFGFSPLYHEPWHWEALVPRANWFSGEEFAPLIDGVPNYNIKSCGN